MTTVDEPRTLAAPDAWVPSAETFGARLALIRQRMGWGNVKTAATECGLPVETWRTWERDNVTPSRLLAIAERISLRTGCDYLWLVHGPDRGDVTHTGRYGPEPHVVATMPRVAGVAVDHTRPVRQTRPAAGGLRSLVPSRALGRA